MSKVRCANCGWDGDSEELNVLKKAWERVQPGDVMPDGECPECGSAAFEVTVNDELIKRAEGLLELVKFENYTFTVREGHGGVFFQATYPEECVVKKVIETQYTRKWLLSPEQTDSEIVLSAFKCCLTSAEHRCREAFTYKGRRICGPHYDVEDMVKLCKDGRGGAGARK